MSLTRIYTARQPFLPVGAREALMSCIVPLLRFFYLRSQGHSVHACL